jgi:hypothetical protein
MCQKITGIHEGNDAQKSSLRFGLRQLLLPQLMRNSTFVNRIDAQFHVLHNKFDAVIYSIYYFVPYNGVSHEMPCMRGPKCNLPTLREFLTSASKGSTHVGTLNLLPFTNGSRTATEGE